MSIEQIDIVDCIGVNELDGRVTLAISDHLDWHDEQKHIAILREKLNTYLRFIESGEIYQSYPKANGREIVIEVVARFDLTENGNAFIAEATKVIKTAGISLIFRKLI